MNKLTIKDNYEATGHIATLHCQNQRYVNFIEHIFSELSKDTHGTSSYYWSIRGTLEKLQKEYVDLKNIQNNDDNTIYYDLIVQKDKEISILKELQAKGSPEHNVAIEQSVFIIKEKDQFYRAKITDLEKQVLAQKKEYEAALTSLKTEMTKNKAAFSARLEEDTKTSALKTRKITEYYENQALRMSQENEALKYELENIKKSMSNLKEEYAQRIKNCLSTQ